MHYLHNAQDHEDDVAKAHYCKGKARKVAACLKAVTIAYFSVAPEFPNDLSEELLRANAPKVLEKFENLTSKGKWKTNVSAKEEETEEDRDEEVAIKLRKVSMYKICFTVIIIPAIWYN